LSNKKHRLCPSGTLDIAENLLTSASYLGYSTPNMAKLIIRDSDTIRKKVYHHIRERILSGEIAPGDRLIETRLAQEIGTSRTPVREALHSLELEKLIKSIPRVGYVVETLSEEEVEQICEIRRVIEALAARWAMEKSQGKLARDLARNLGKQEKALNESSLRDYIELDAQFHDIIARLSGSDRLFELVQTLRRHMLRYRTHVVLALETAERSVDGHRRIVQAIEVGNADLAIETLQHHLQQAKEDILQYVFSEDHQGQG
jgi:DNA-binding GntR family transcriptional regulator